MTLSSRCCLYAFEVADQLWLFVKGAICVLIFWFLVYKMGFPLRCPCGQHTTELPCSPSPPFCSARTRLSSYRSLKCVSVTHNKSHTVARKIRFRRASKRKERKAKVPAQSFFFFENYTYKIKKCDFHTHSNY